MEPDKKSDPLRIDLLADLARLCVAARPMAQDEFKGAAWYVRSMADGDAPEPADPRGGRA